MNVGAKYFDQTGQCYWHQAPTLHKSVDMDTLNKTKSSSTRPSGCFPANSRMTAWFLFGNSSAAAAKKQRSHSADPRKPFHRSNNNGTCLVASKRPVDNGVSLPQSSLKTGRVRCNGSSPSRQRGVSSLFRRTFSFRSKRSPSPGLKEQSTPSIRPFSLHADPVNFQSDDASSHYNPFLYQQRQLRHSPITTNCLSTRLPPYTPAIGQRHQVDPSTSTNSQLLPRFLDISSNLGNSRQRQSTVTRERPRSELVLTTTTASSVNQPSAFRPARFTNRVQLNGNGGPSQVRSFRRLSRGGDSKRNGAGVDNRWLNGKSCGSGSGDTGGGGLSKSVTWTLPTTCEVTMCHVAPKPSINHNENQQPHNHKQPSSQHQYFHSQGPILSLSQLVGRRLSRNGRIEPQEQRLGLNKNVDFPSARIHHCQPSIPTGDFEGIKASRRSILYDSGIALTTASTTTTNHHHHNESFDPWTLQCCRHVRVTREEEKVIDGDRLHLILDSGDLDWKTRVRPKSDKDRQQRHRQSLPFSDPRTDMSSRLSPTCYAEDAILDPSRNSPVKPIERRRSRQLNLESSNRTSLPPATHGFPTSSGNINKRPTSVICLDRPSWGRQTFLPNSNRHSLHGDGNSSDGRSHTPVKGDEQEGRSMLAVQHRSQPTAPPFLRPPRPPIRTTSLVRGMTSLADLDHRINSDEQEKQRPEVKSIGGHLSISSGSSSDLSDGSQSLKSLKLTPISNTQLDKPVSQTQTSSRSSISHAKTNSLPVVPLDSPLHDYSQFLTSSTPPSSTATVTPPVVSEPWWSRLLPYKPSNIPYKLADRLKQQRNSLAGTSPSSLSINTLKSSSELNCIGGCRADSPSMVMMTQSMFAGIMPPNNHQQSTVPKSVVPQDVGLMNVQFSRRRPTSCNGSARPASLCVVTRCCDSQSPLTPLPSLNHLTSRSKAIPTNRVKRPTSLSFGPPPLLLHSPSVMSTSGVFVDSTNVDGKSPPSSVSSNLNETLELATSSTALLTKVIGGGDAKLSASKATDDSPVLGQYGRLLILKSKNQQQKSVDSADKCSNGSVSTTICASNVHSVFLSEDLPTPVSSP